MKEIECKLRVARAIEIAKRQRDVAPPWNASGPTTWIFYGWQPPEGGIPAWDKNKPETWPF
eukprot:4832258-Pyramimonas_sp.AAC.1